MAHLCIFCGRGPTTEEHAIPDWLNREFAGRPSEVTFRGRSRNVKTVLEFPVKPHLVCRRCNEGWMSRLEAHTKPQILAMLQQRIQLVPPFPITAWAVKTVMVMEQLFADQQGVYYTGDERRAFMEDSRHEPPGDTVVDLGWRPSSEISFQFFSTSMSNVRDGEPPYRRFAMHFGPLAIRVQSTGFFSRGRPSVYKTHISKPTLGSNSMRIYPGQRPYLERGCLLWPPPVALSDADLISW
jgi:hypothetical protein